MHGRRLVDVRTERRQCLAQSFCLRPAIGRQQVGRTPETLARAPSARGAESNALCIANLCSTPVVHDHVDGMPPIARPPLLTPIHGVDTPGRTSQARRRHTAPPRRTSAARRRRRGESGGDDALSSAEPSRCVACGASFASRVYTRFLPLYSLHHHRPLHLPPPRARRPLAAGGAATAPKKKAPGSRSLWRFDSATVPHLPVAPVLRGDEQQVRLELRAEGGGDVGGGAGSTATQAMPPAPKVEVVPQQLDRQRDADGAAGTTARRRLRCGPRTPRGGRRAHCRQALRAPCAVVDAQRQRERRAGCRPKVSRRRSRAVRAGEAQVGRRDLGITRRVPAKSGRGARCVAPRARSAAPGVWPPMLYLKRRWRRRTTKMSTRARQRSAYST